MQRLGYVFGAWLAAIGASYVTAEIGWQVWSSIASFPFYVRLCGEPQSVPEMAAPAFLGIGFLVLYSLLMVPAFFVALACERRWRGRSAPFALLLLIYPTLLFGLHLGIGPGPEEAAVPFRFRLGCAYAPSFLISEVMMAVTGSTYAYVMWLMSAHDFDVEPGMQK